MKRKREAISTVLSLLCRTFLLGAALAVAYFLPIVRNEAAAQTAASGPYAVTLFGGAMADGNWEDIISLRHVRYRDAALVGVGLSKRFANWRRVADFEIEGQIDRHFGTENNWEFNLPVIARWRAFPWNRFLPTSFAWGIGPSYATEEPAQERAGNGATRQFLIYWVAELEIGLPNEPWTIIARLHHRSTAFGLLGRSGGSNWTLLGIRRRF